MPRVLTTRKVLIVEDNQQMSRLLSEMLEVFDVESLCAASGGAALKMLEEQQFGLVITDLRMPEMSGVELLRAVKEKHPEVPVVVISGFATKKAESEIVAADADGFLQKPFRMEDIGRLLNRILPVG